MEFSDTKAVVPDVLKDYESDLIKAQREYVSIQATPLECGITDDPLELTQSKFLGQPFIPSDMEYPKDENGKPMVLLAQINFSEIPQLSGFPASGLLQLFFSSDGWWDMGTEKVFFHNENDLQKTAISDFSFIDSSLYNELPVFRIHKLNFKKSIDTGCSEDSQFSFMFREKDYWDFEDDLGDIEKEQFHEYFSSTGHKIGGYGDFTQSDPREYEKSQKDDIQLLQIDIDDYIMFGDSGVGHLFIKPNDLESGKFENAWFYWDCC
ncbi:MAG: DUF1963 domain-containing protein [Kangiellaceae bacterium]|nr:DUF1963 domain-containing protein [Kangiellaceae bacterium]MCW9015917.1 DUF1963 domain-containing protein [Kangiellaceae bacterium]